jgi:putative Mg2+ transporter-C (MgtC) family protein
LFLIIVSVELVPSIVRRFGPQVLREKEVELSFVMQSSVPVKAILDRISVLESRVERIKSSDNADGTREVTVYCIVDKSIPLPDLYHQLEDMDGVVKVSATAVD